MDEMERRTQQARRCYRWRGESSPACVVRGTARGVRWAWRITAGLCHAFLVLPYTAPSFRHCLLLPNGWMDEDATWYESRPQPRPHCIRRAPSSPLRERGTAAPTFRPMSIVATVAHLSYCWALVLYFNLLFFSVFQFFSFLVDAH